jgi:hypothetical protein
VREPGDAEAFEALHPGHATPACWTSPTTTGWWRRHDVESRVGPIGVLISIAGEGHEGIIEESTLRHRLATLP